MSESTCVFRSSSAAHAELVASALRSMGIEVRVLTFSAANHSVPEAQLVVLAADVNDARAAIAELEAQES